MANTSPCSSCKYYDPILKGEKPTPRGWCVKRSLYPARDNPGQITPPDARRVPEGETLAKPYIVPGAGVVSTCLTYVLRPKPKSKAQLQAMARGGGK